MASSFSSMCTMDIGSLGLLKSKYLNPSLKLSSLDLKHDNEDESSSSDGESEDEPQMPGPSVTFMIDTKPSTSEQTESTDDFTKEVKHEEETKTSPRKNDKVKLASSLNPGIDTSGLLYIPGKNESTSEEQLTKAKKLMKTLTAVDDLLEKSVVKPGFEQQHAVPPYSESQRKLKKERRIERSKTKGPGWYNLPATELTEERKNDLMVLQMRNILDPKHFYKKNDLKTLPKYFQVGTVVETPFDFYHSRVPKKQRKQTIVEELLADAEFRKYNKRKYAEVLAKNPEGLRRAYKHMKRLKKQKK